MPNAPESKWFATPRALRNRKPLSVTLSEEAREKLEAMAAKAGATLSASVEALVLGHPVAGSDLVMLPRGDYDRLRRELDLGGTWRPWRRYEEEKGPPLPPKKTREASDLPSKPRGKTAKKAADLDPETSAALRAFVKERVKKPATKKR